MQPQNSDVLILHFHPCMLILLRTHLLVKTLPKENFKSFFIYLFISYNIH